MKQKRFWEDTPLFEMSISQWESLCDGCGKCCVLKLEDFDTGEIYYTDVSCKLLDCGKARCRNYNDRKTLVPDCVVLEPDTMQTLSWMPDSCAYRLLFEGKNLPEWHPLVTGNPDSTKLAGQSVANKVTPEAEVDVEELPDHIRVW